MFSQGKFDPSNFSNAFNRCRKMEDYEIFRFFYTNCLRQVQVAG